MTPLLGSSGSVRHPRFRLGLGDDHVALIIGHVRCFALRLGSEPTVWEAWNFCVSPILRCRFIRKLKSRCFAN